MRRTVTVLAALSTLVLTGCDQQSAESGSKPTASSQKPEPTASQEPAKTTPTPTAPSAAATSSGTPLPKASDGSDISACLDGTCEVRVRAPRDIPFAPETGIRKLTVDSVSAQGVRITGSTTTGTQYSMELFADPGGLATAAINNRFLVAALGVVKGEAVIRVSPQ